jgi:hypothetical protein
MSHTYTNTREKWEEICSVSNISAVGLQYFIYFDLLLSAVNNYH